MQDPIFTKYIFTFGTSTFTPFVLPINCGTIEFRNIANGPDIYLRTDPNDANTQDVLRADDQEVISPPYSVVRLGSNQYTNRYRAGMTAGWFLCGTNAGNGTGTIMVTMFGEA